MLRWMCGLTKKDKIRTDHSRGSEKMAPVLQSCEEEGIRALAGKNIRCSLPGERQKRKAKDRKGRHKWKDTI